MGTATMRIRVSMQIDVVILEHSDDDAPTASTTQKGEEGIRGKAPSTHEISLLTKLTQHTQTSRLSTLKRTTNHVKPHHKTPANRARNTIPNQEQRPNSKQKT
jgi:hypothetical protein